MLKKYIALLLSLLISLSIIPGQAQASEIPEPCEPPVLVEQVDPGTPDKNDPPDGAASVSSVPDSEGAGKPAGSA